MQNQWIESPSYSDHPLYFPIGQGLFYVHGALINSAPFQHSTGPTTKHYRPHHSKTCVTRSHSHTRFHKHTHNCSPPGWAENEGDSAHSG
ncbi:hypothetical protein QQF64_002221 [Cirrhinus molitorella]|uniref:Uncharacterized protein n=1 Tax=Cirrhinus molitorella TaxID=172907 RepID=A0ABR3MPJ5_9TELE